MSIIDPRAILYDASGNAIAVSTTPPASTDRGLAVRTISPSKQDTNNSYFAPAPSAILGGGASWTGSSTDTLGYASIDISASSDVPSATNGIELQFSPDGVYWSTRVKTDLRQARTGTTEATDLEVRCHDRYFRVKYTNGAAAQTWFKLNIYLHTHPASGDTRGVDQVPVSGDDAALVKAIVSGRTGSSTGLKFTDVTVDSTGAMNVTQGDATGVFGGMSVVPESVKASFKSPFGLLPRVAVQTTANGGSISWASAMTTLATSTNVAGSALITTRECLRYVPGQGNIARFAPVFGAPATNSIKIAGMFTANNGFAFGYNGTSFGVLIRKGGVDTWVTQANWNGNDRFDGTGPSGVTLNPLNGIPMQIKMQWLGFGAVTWYIEDPNTGGFVKVHTYRYAATSTTPSVNNPSLPVACYVANTGNNTNLTMGITSMSGLSEGEADSPAEDLRNSFTAATTAAGTTGKTVFSLQNKATNIYGGTNTNTVNVHIDQIGVRAATNRDLYVTIFLNSTITTPTWADINTAQSVMQSDVAGTGTGAGGIALLTLPVAGGTTLNEDLKNLNIRMVPGDTLSFVMFAETATVDGRVTCSWHEEH